MESSLPYLGSTADQDMVHSQGCSFWSTGFTVNSWSRQYANFGKMDLPVKEAHSFGSNT